MSAFSKPLNRKNKLKEKFNQRTRQRLSENKEFKPLSGLIKINPKTIEWYNKAFGGGYND